MRLIKFKFSLDGESHYCEMDTNIERIYKTTLRTKILASIVSVVLAALIVIFSINPVNNNWDSTNIFLSILLTVALMFTARIAIYVDCKGILLFNLFLYNDFVLYINESKEIFTKRMGEIKDERTKRLYEEQLHTIDKLIKVDSKLVELDNNISNMDENNVTVAISNICMQLLKEITLFDIKVIKYE